MEELLKLLPPPALLALGAVLGLGFLVRQFGLLQGQTASTARSPAAAEVAAVIVDPAALNRATAALEAHTYEMVNFRKSMERGHDALCRSAERLSEEIDDLKLEMTRGKGR